METSPAAAIQAAPVANDAPGVWALVLADMHERDAVGAAKYGVHLQPENGRDALVDAYQEALDLVVYLRQRIEEARRQRARVEAKFGWMRKNACGLTLDQETEILATLAGEPR